MLLDRLNYMVQMQLKRMHGDKVVLVTRRKGFGFGLETCQGKKPDGALIGEGKRLVSCLVGCRTLAKLLANGGENGKARLWQLLNQAKHHL